MRKPIILITGANGQIGTVLTAALRMAFGESQVIATDLRTPKENTGPFEILDVTNSAAVHEIIGRHRCTEVYHLVAVLSAKGEADPMASWHLNMQSYFNVMEACRAHGVSRIFFPSSIAAFGPDTPGHPALQKPYMAPTTVYGISKVAGELWSQYFVAKYHMDIRSLRYPGIIGYQSLPGGGTTDYAVDIYHHAIQDKAFTCFLNADTRLPMMYMDDAVRATMELMEAPSSQLSIHTSYNLAGMSFTPAEIAASIQGHHPNFNIVYVPDFRQQIAESWPAIIDDSAAQNDWQWKPAYDLESMTTDMLLQLGHQYQKV